MQTPQAIIIGGANGAGKTTFARLLLPELPSSVAFLNADEIQRSSSAFDHPVAAGKELIRRLEEAVAAGESFAVETTLASLRYAKSAAAWRAAGYEVTLHYIELPSADYAVERVRRRVAAGGHSIPEDEVRRRFARGLANFAGHYRGAVDQCYHWRSDDAGIQFIAAT